MDIIYSKGLKMYIIKHKLVDNGLSYFHHFLLQPDELDEFLSRADELRYDVHKKGYL